MKSLRVLRNLSSLSSTKLHNKTQFNPSTLCQFFSSQSQLDHPTTSENETDNESSTFDSTHFDLPPEITQKLDSQKVGPTWDESLRTKVKSRVFGEEVSTKGKLRVKEKGKKKVVVAEEEEEERRRVLARSLLEAALDAPDEEDEEEEGLEVKEEDQKSLSVGIIGAPNAGKSALTNYMVSLLLIFFFFAFELFSSFFVWLC